MRYAPLDDWFVTLQKAVTRSAHELEALFKAEFVNVVEKQAADTAGFIAVLEIEILIAPLLVSGVQILTEWVADGFCVPVPMHNVIVERVIRCQVEASTEPPDRFAFAGREKAEVRMSCRHVGVVRMQYQGNTNGLERLTSEFGPILCRCRWHLFAKDMRKTDARLLKYSTVRQDAAFTTATARALPGVPIKCRLAVERFQLRTDAVLQIGKVCFYVFDVAHWTLGRKILPLMKSRISDGPDDGPQSPG